MYESKNAVSRRGFLAASSITIVKAEAVRGSQANSNYDRHLGAHGHLHGAGTDLERSIRHRLIAKASAGFETLTAAPQR